MILSWRPSVAIYKHQKFYWKIQYLTEKNNISKREILNYIKKLKFLHLIISIIYTIIQSVWLQAKQILWPYKSINSNLFAKNADGKKEWIYPSWKCYNNFPSIFITECKSYANNKN